MVQAVAPTKKVLKKSDFNPDWRLGIKPEYFECPICFEIKKDILECPHCHAKACTECVKDFNDGKQGRASAHEMGQGIYACT